MIHQEEDFVNECLLKRCFLREDLLKECIRERERERKRDRKTEGDIDGETKIYKDNEIDRERKREILTWICL